MPPVNLCQDCSIPVLKLSSVSFNALKLIDLRNGLKCLISAYSYGPAHVPDYLYGFRYPVAVGTELAEQGTPVYVHRGSRLGERYHLAGRESLPSSPAPACVWFIH